MGRASKNRTEPAPVAHVPTRPCSHASGGGIFMLSQLARRLGSLNRRTGAISGERMTEKCFTT